MASIKYNNKTLRAALKDYFKNPSTIDLNTWDTSEVTDMSKLFKNKDKFNKPLNSWNTANVTKMNDMFFNCKEFNQPLDQWNTSIVTDMDIMFVNCVKFNQPLNSWNVSRVTNMKEIFFNCKEFNQPLDQWNTSSVTNMRHLFSNCVNFNQPLNLWNTENVTNMKEMFFNCKEFNQPLNNWNTSNVTVMESMFVNCVKFNQPLNNWNVSRVTDMGSMFLNCVKFNQPLNNWTTEIVTNMSNMFNNCETFNQPLNNWNVSRVTNMVNMFHGCIQFNQPLNNWNITNANLDVDSMRNIFYRCGPIAQNNIPLWVRAMNPNPQVRAMNPNPQVRANPIPPTRAVAYEIHNAFNQHYDLNKDKYFEIIGLPGQTNSMYYTSLPNVNNYIKPKLLELIQRVYPADAINVKTAQMNQILTTINNARDLSEKPDTKLLLGKTVDFLVTQSNEFVRFYLDTLKYDCLNAYSSDSPISCVKGMIERFYLTMGDTAYALCPDPDTCNNPKYNELVSLFNKRFDKNELTQEWNETFLEDPIKREDLLKLDKEERKDHYRQFMIQKYRDAGQIPTEKAKQMVLRDIIEPEIVSLDYVFDGLQFGGTKKKTGKNKSRKNKSKSRKNKSRKNKSKKNKSRNNKSKSKKY
jgi:surface protein